ncbi:MAG: GYD domain-containing protein [Dehalococcoidia bacterium]
MPRYLIRGNYVGDGLRGLLQEGGTRRREAVEQLVGSLGGKIESLYYAFGDTDIYVIVDMPDNAAMASVALTAAATGTVAVETVVLMTAEELDEAVKKSPTFRPPGQ